MISLIHRSYKNISSFGKLSPSAKATITSSNQFKKLAKIDPFFPLIIPKMQTKGG